MMRRFFGQFKNWVIMGFLWLISSDYDVFMVVFYNLLLAVMNKYEAAPGI